jgi:NAD-dependent dihydropyrimidine dehydrogenase PreA subunit
MEKLRDLPGVTTLALDADACVGCGTCAVVCPHGAVRMQNGKAWIADRDGCMECGACAQNCATGAIRVTPGVGCAAYIIKKWIKGKNAAACGEVNCC